MKRIFAALILAVLCTSCGKQPEETGDVLELDGRDIAVLAGVDDQKKYIGQEFLLTLQARYGADIESNWPDIGNKLGEFNVSKTVLQASKRLDDSTIISKRCWLIYVDEPGTFTIPSLELEYSSGTDTPGRISTDPIEVELLSNFTGEEQPVELKDIKGPSTIKMRYARLYRLIAAVIIVASAGSAGG